MAVVRLSESLKGDIKKNSMVYFDTKVQNVKNSYSVDLGDRFYDLVFKDYPEMQTMPDGFFDTEGSITIVTFCCLSVSREFRLSAAKRFPYRVKTPDAESGWRHNLISYKASSSPSSPEEQAMFDELTRVESELRKVRSAREEFSKALEDLLNKHHTLSTALKEWQPLWDYVPQEYKNRHLQTIKREKKEVEQIDPSVLAKMTTVAVTSKLVR